MRIRIPAKEAVRLKAERMRKAGFYQMSNPLEILGYGVVDSRKTVDVDVRAGDVGLVVITVMQNHIFTDRIFKSPKLLVSNKNGKCIVTQSFRMLDVAEIIGLGLPILDELEL